METWFATHFEPSTVALKKWKTLVNISIGRIEMSTKWDFILYVIWNNGTKLSSSCSFPFDLFASFIQKEQSFLFHNHFAKLRKQLWSTFALSWSFPKLFDCPHGRQHLLVYEIMWHLHLWPLLLAVPLKMILRKLIITTSS